MIDINITFSTDAVPNGMQVQDIIWYVNGSGSIDADPGTEIQVGPIVSITTSSDGDLTYVLVTAPPGVVPPGPGDFIFYVKNPIVEVSSLKGYFAETQFINKSTEYAELFAVASEVFESSK